MMRSSEVARSQWKKPCALPGALPSTQQHGHRRGVFPLSSGTTTFITQDPFGASYCLTCAKYLQIRRDPLLNYTSFFDFSLSLLLEAREDENAP